MKRLKYGHLSILTLLTLALTGAGCKNDCDKSVDHLAHLSWIHAQAEAAEQTKDLPHMTPEFKAEVAKYTPSEAQMLPTMRKIGHKRFGARCQDPAFTKCVLASKDIWGIAQCEHPLTPEELELSKKIGGR